MGELKIDNFFCLNGYFWNLFLPKYLLSSPLHFISLSTISLNLIGCQGDRNGKFRKNVKKKFLLKNHKVDEGVTFHTCLWHYPQHKLYFCFGQLSTLVAMATVFIVMAIPGKKSGERFQDHWSSGF